MTEKEFIKWLDGYMTGVSDKDGFVPQWVGVIREKLEDIRPLEENKQPVVYTHPTTTLKD
jgi:hypothetical protein